MIGTIIHIDSKEKFEVSSLFASKVMEKFRVLCGGDTYLPSGEVKRVQDFRRTINEDTTVRNTPTLTRSGNFISRDLVGNWDCYLSRAQIKQLEHDMRWYGLKSIDLKRVGDAIIVMGGQQVRDCGSHAPIEGEIVIDWDEVILRWLD